MTVALSRPPATRELWLDAAYELLISEGIEAVKIMSLAKKLNLTRTGFYWFFEDINELRRAMVHRWESRNTQNLLKSCDSHAVSICEALFNLMNCWLDPTLFDARLDLAIRNWARNDSDLELRLRKADKLRVEAVIALFSQHGFSQEQANVRGMTVIYTQIGYISMQVEEAPKERLERVRHYVELFAGTKPSIREVQKFLLQHSSSNNPLSQ